MRLSFRQILIHAVVVMITTAVASPSRAAGQIDASTVIAIPLGTFNGVRYKQYEAMFDRRFAACHLTCARGRTC